MADSAESVVHEFLQAREAGDLDTVLGLLDQDIVFTDGGRGVHQGRDAVRMALQDLGARPVTRTVRSLVATDRTVLMERSDSFIWHERTITYDIAVAFDVDESGKITRWHEYYDRKSIADQISALETAT